MSFSMKPCKQTGCVEPPVIEMPRCSHEEKVVAIAFLKKGERIIIENAARSGKQALIDKLKEIFSRPENNPKAERVFTETEETAKNIMDYYQYDPPEYNQTKYIHNKPNARPIVNGFKRMARNNIKQRQK